MSRNITPIYFWVFDNFCQKMNFEIAEKYEFHRSGISLPVMKCLERQKCKNC